MKKVRIYRDYKKLKTSINPLWIIFAILTLYLSLVVNPVFLILGIFFGFLAYRLFCGKLIVKSGDVILFWGLPGSGKSCFLNKVALDNKRLGKRIAGNEEFHQSSSLSDFEFRKSYWGFFDPGPCMHAIEEASLEGWDNRDWSINFVPESLDEWKKIRHRDCAAVLTNQGFTELDCKIRDSLTSVVYYVEDKGSYSTATRMKKNVIWGDDGKPVEGYEMPSLLDRLFDPSAMLFVRHKAIGKFFNTRNPRPLIPLSDLDKYEPVIDKKGRTVAWQLKEEETSDNGQ